MLCILFLYEFIKGLPIVLSKACFNVAVSQCKPHVPNSFGGMAWSEVVASHIFPQVVLAVVTLVGHWTGDGGAGTMTEVELPLHSVAITALLCIASDP